MKTDLRDIHTTQTTISTSKKAHASKRNGETGESSGIRAGDSLFNVVRYFVNKTPNKDRREYICCKQPSNTQSDDFSGWIAISSSFDKAVDLPAVIVSPESVIYMSSDGSCRCSSLLDFLHEYSVITILRSKSVIRNIGISKSILRWRTREFSSRSRGHDPTSGEKQDPRAAAWCNSQ